MSICLSCKQEVSPMKHMEESEYQLDNALWIGFFGGYGMFVDSDGYESKPKMIEGSDSEALICHDCAHDLCVKVPWINELLQPMNSHAHTQEYWDKNPEHKGWDNPDPESKERKALDARLVEQKAANEEFMKKLRKKLTK